MKKINNMIILMIFFMLSYISVANNNSIDLTKYSNLSMPIPKKDGRGEAIENLVIKYGEDYINDPNLKDDVIKFRQWEWNDLYNSLNEQSKEHPNYLNIYRLQIQAYLINQNYKEAISQSEQILKRNSHDLQALVLSSIVFKILGDKTEWRNRTNEIKLISEKTYTKLNLLVNLVDYVENRGYTTEPLTNMVPDVIAVFGQTPKSDGTPSMGMLDRLLKAKEMAEKFPKAKIILSGGPVNTQYPEAEVMKKWLVDNGISSSRIYLDLLARDTPGNAIGIIGIMKENNWNKVLCVGTLLHINRAVSVMFAYSDKISYPIQVDGVGGGFPPSKAKQYKEKFYTYINVLRAGGLFTLSDFE